MVDDNLDVPADSSTAQAAESAQPTTSPVVETQPNEALSEQNSESNSFFDIANEVIKGTKKADADTPKDPPKDKVDPPKPEVKPDDGSPVDVEVPAGVRSKKASERYQELHKNWKAAETERDTLRKELDSKLKEWEPAQERLKVWDDLITTNKLESELKTVGEYAEATIVNSLRFQAAVQRLSTGNGTPNDQAIVKSGFDAFDKTREHLGLTVSKQSSIARSELEDAIREAESDIHMPKLRALLKKLDEQPAPKAIQTRQLAPEPEVQQVKPTAESISEDPVQVQYYTGMVVDKLTSDGVKDVSTYVKEKLSPIVMHQISKLVPGKDPMEVYRRLSPEAKHVQVLQAHSALRARDAKLAPKPAIVQSNPGPVRQSQSATTPPMGGLQFAMDYLTQK